VVDLRGRTLGSFRSKDSPWKVFEVVDLRGRLQGYSKAKRVH
jgi:hypothetical protein